LATYKQHISQSKYVYIIKEYMWFCGIDLAQDYILYYLAQD